MTLLLKQQLQLLLSRESTLQGASQHFTEHGDEQGYYCENRDSNEMSHAVDLPIQLRSHGQNAQTRRNKATSAIVQDGRQKNGQDQDNEFERTCRNSGAETKQEEHRNKDDRSAISDYARLTRRRQKFQ
jgi:hypothetical protein